MTKKVTSKKIGVTTSVAAPGDTHPSDATVLTWGAEWKMQER